MSSPVSKTALWIGRIMSALPTLLLLMGGIMDLVKPASVVQQVVQLGYPENVITPLGVVVIVCTLLYAIPCTSVFGAILLTGYLGGAVATHVRHGDPLFSHILAPVYFAVFVWGGLFFREPRLRALIPLKRRSAP